MDFQRIFSTFRITAIPRIHEELSGAEATSRLGFRTRIRKHF